MRIASIFVAVVLYVFTTSHLSAQSFRPKFTAMEGQLKGSNPPVWQMIATIRVNEESDLNPRFNQLSSAIVNFANKRGDSATGLLLMVTAEEKYFEQINKVIGGVLEESASRSNSTVIRNLKVSVSLSDPVTKQSRDFIFKTQ